MPHPKMSFEYRYDADESTWSSHTTSITDTWLTTARAKEIDVHDYYWERNQRQTLEDEVKKLRAELAEWQSHRAANPGGGNHLQEFESLTRRQPKINRGYDELKREVKIKMRIPILMDVFEHECAGITREIYIGDLHIWVSPNYPLAFEHPQYGLVVSDNETSDAGDGRVLNIIEPNKERRISREEMLYLLDKCLVEEVLNRR